MKRALFGVAVALCLSLAGISQAHAQGLTLGLQGGYNFSSLSSVPEDVSEVKDKGGLVLGAFLDVQFHDMLYLGVEANYTENKSDVTDTDGTSGFKQNYIQIPAVLGVRLLKGLIQPVLYAGAAINFETSCDIDPEGGTSQSCSDVQLDTKSSIWNAVFGGGVNLAVGPIILNGDVRYNLGLTKVSPDDDSKWNNWMFLIGAGLRLGS